MVFDEGDKIVTMRLDRPLTKKQKVAATAKKAAKKVEQATKAALIKYSPGAKNAAKQTAKAVGSLAWELFTATKAGKRVQKKLRKDKKKGKKIIRKR